ncbi:toxin-antitoxin system YwqK family antitoxin [Fusobacterium canifelinum]|uniref:Toxin-antitoxin system YwqK family antitoxin n=1 Tax=Fusobacterium canifelinum TaxID=285729 RepID=A0A7T4FQK1_9FUSO|nr:toxin-antitoxin system YwqK family antitoxin [Fusobacterium canifelinum]QQB74777.1 toxin-antitoxin system YwqK family antitoxin [Fusobacterium canifelinum]
MKKILSTLLLLFAMLLSACGGVKYEFKDGVMYGDGKEVTGTFEFKSGKHKMKGTFINGLADGLFEKYYSDGSIMIKNTFVKGENIKEELYYKSGQLMGDFKENEDLKLYYNDGKLVMTYNDKTGESIIYHDNGNPFIATNTYESSIYNENNELLFKVEKGNLVETGATLRKLNDGSFEYLKDNKVIATIDSNLEIINYLYSTGELMVSSNNATGASEIFFKNGTTFMKKVGNKNVLNYRDGKTLYEIEGNLWNIYNEEGDNISSDFEVVTDIKKID